MFQLKTGNLLFACFCLKVFLAVVTGGILNSYSPLLPGSLPSSKAYATAAMEVVNVTGDITANTIWEGGKIYRISGVKSVADGAVLTISPGAVVKFVDNGVLKVSGELKASGAVAAPIYFTVGSDSSPEVGLAVNGTGVWQGIQLMAGGRVSLEHSEIRSAAGSGLKLGGSGAVLCVKDSAFLSNSTAVEIASGAAEIINCVFRDNDTSIKIDGGRAVIRGNRFYFPADNRTRRGINITALNEKVEILENSFAGSFMANSTGIRIFPKENPANRLLQIMFNTFEKLGKGLEIIQGGHSIRGNNFASTAYGVYFAASSLYPQEKADIRYNFWNSANGPTYTGYLAGVKIEHIDLLEFRPWGTRAYRAAYEPPQVSILHPVAGGYIVGSGELLARVDDVNLKEIVFALDDRELYRFTAEKISGENLFSLTWEPENGQAKSSYIFSVKALNHLGEEVEEALFFHYLGEMPPLPVVRILAPADGSCLNSSVTVEIEGFAPEELGAAGLVSLYLEINGERMAAVGSGAEKLSWYWDITGYAEGEYLLTAVATDALGREASASAAVVVSLMPTPPEEAFTPLPEQDNAGTAEENHRPLQRRAHEDGALSSQERVALFTEGDKEEEKAAAEREAVAGREMTGHINVTEIFRDLDPGHGVLEAISFLYARGIFKGVEKDRFAPEMPLYRAQAAALFTRLPFVPGGKGSVASYGSFFKDLDEGAWYAPAASRATAIGLLRGYPDRTFRPTVPITGAEFAVLLKRLEHFLLSDSGSGKLLSPADEEKSLREAMLGRTPPWARSSVAALLESGIIGNDELCWFDPHRTGPSAGPRQLSFCGEPASITGYVKTKLTLPLILCFINLQQPCGLTFQKKR